MSATGLVAGGPSPRPRSKRASEIASAARLILETEGREALTMRHLAEDLGIQAPSLYKHFPNKAALEAAIIDDAMAEIGLVTLRAIETAPEGARVKVLLETYRRYSLAHGNLYRLATSGRLPRELLQPGLEEWAGSPWFLVTGDENLAQALWSFAHGIVILELDGRYPDGSDMAATLEAGAAAFERARRS